MEASAMETDIGPRPGELDVPNVLQDLTEDLTRQSTATSSKWRTRLDSASSLMPPPPPRLPIRTSPQQLGERHRFRVQDMPPHKVNAPLAGSRFMDETNPDRVASALSRKNAHRRNRRWSPVDHGACGWRMHGRQPLSPLEGQVDKELFLLGDGRLSPVAPVDGRRSRVTKGGRASPRAPSNVSTSSSQSVPATSPSAGASTPSDAASEISDDRHFGLGTSLSGIGMVEDEEETGGDDE